jgi:hypothetical protein
VAEGRDPGNAGVEGGSWAKPPATRKRLAQAAEPEEDEGAAQAAPQTARGPAASKGAEAFDAVRNGAKYTLRGLRQWQEATRWATLGQFLGLIAAVLLLAVLGLAAAGIGGLGLLGTAGIYLGVVALLLWLWSMLHFLRGLRSARRGRGELGFLQGREVDAAFALVLRGLVLLVVLGAVAMYVASQAATMARAGRVPDAVAIGLVIGAVAGGAGAWHFASAVEGVLRNLTPRAGKRGRQRFVALAVLASVPAVAAFLVGAPLIGVNYGVACQELGACPGGDLVGTLSPSYGAPLTLLTEPPAVLIAWAPAAGAAVLLLARVLGYRALHALRAHLSEGERFLVNHVAAHAQRGEAARAGE